MDAELSAEDSSTQRGAADSQGRHVLQLKCLTATRHCLCISAPVGCSPYLLHCAFRAPGRVLMGHSLGAACAAAEVIANPEVHFPSFLCSSARRRHGLAQACRQQLQDLTQRPTIIPYCPQGVDALVLVAPAIVAMSFGWHERKEEAHAEAAARASGDKVAAAKAAASTAEFQSNTAGRLMCAFYLLQRRSRKEMHIVSASWLPPWHPVVGEHRCMSSHSRTMTCRLLSTRSPSVLMASTGSASGAHATRRCGSSLLSAMLRLRRRRAVRCGSQRLFWCRCVTVTPVMLW
jgi:hypothetical protein